MRQHNNPNRHERPRSKGERQKRTSIDMNNNKEWNCKKLFSIGYNVMPSQTSKSSKIKKIFNVSLEIKEITDANNEKLN